MRDEAKLESFSSAKGVGVICAILFVLFLLWRWHVLYTPEYALSLVDSIKTQNDIQNCNDYMTTQGAKVITHAVANQRGPATNHPLEFQPKQIRGTTCFFPFVQANNAGYLEFQQQGVWKFHDLVITRHNGREIELSVAYAIDHPILAALQNADWNAVFDSFIRGFLIGLQLGAG